MYIYKIFNHILLLFISSLITSALYRYNRNNNNNNSSEGEEEEEKKRRRRKGERSCRVFSQLDSLIKKFFYHLHINFVRILIKKNKKKKKVFSFVWLVNNSLVIFKSCQSNCTEKAKLSLTYFFFCYIISISMKIIYFVYEKFLF